jgi:hypothetical protein
MPGRARRSAPWWRLCGSGAIAAALPSAIWRLVVGVGVPLGTPASWRTSQHLPGSGTAYLIALSSLQLAAAAATLIVIVPGADRIPARSPIGADRRLPGTLVVSAGVAGVLLVGVVCAASIANWARVDPFRDAEAVTGWAVLCWACYGVTPLWPILLVGALVGFARHGRARA